MTGQGVHVIEAEIAMFQVRSTCSITVIGEGAHMLCVLAMLLFGTYSQPHKQHQGASGVGKKSVTCEGVRVKAIASESAANKSGPVVLVVPP